VAAIVKRTSLLYVLVGLIVVGLMVTAYSGCNRGPRAPELEAGPIFQSKTEGIRLRVPDGWVQTTRAELPPGKLDKERLLVNYRATNRMAAFELSASDAVEGADLASYLSDRGYGAQKWTKVGEPETVPIGDLSGARYQMTGRIGKDNMTLEVTVVRKGNRVYLFKGLFASSDKTAREEIRGALKSVVMKGA
jgi:predicted Zn-dependent protease